MVWHFLFRSLSLVVVHTNLITITYLITDQDLDSLLDLDRLLDRDRLADLGFVFDRLIASVIVYMPLNPSP